MEEFRHHCIWPVSQIDQQPQKQGENNIQPPQDSNRCHSHNMPLELDTSAKMMKMINPIMEPIPDEEDFDFEEECEE